MANSPAQGRETVQLHVGGPLPVELADAVYGLYWLGGTHLAIVAPDDYVTALANAPVGNWEVGVAQTRGSLILVVRVRDGGGTFIGQWETTVAYVTDTAPVVTDSERGHLLWTVAVCERTPAGPPVVQHLAGFTTNERLTKAVFALQGEQAQDGPVDVAELAERMRAWAQRNGIPREAWRACVATSRAGT